MVRSLSFRVQVRGQQLTFRAPQNKPEAFRSPRDHQNSGCVDSEMLTLFLEVQYSYDTPFCTKF